jgi:nicotinate-nucleotide--dimethylbenzimidazole phosphoribosyltransferase
VSHPAVRLTVEKWLKHLSGRDSAGSHEDILIRKMKDHWDHLTKPTGSLGQLESLAIWYGRVHGSASLPDPRTAVCVFAGDHGVTRAGVSAYPSSVTREMVRTFAEGGAAISVLTRHLGMGLAVVDVGVDGDLSGIPGVISRKVLNGTRNFLEEPAMTPEEGIKAMEAGREMAHMLVNDGYRLLVTGEMGIGNTTASSALAAALLPMAAEEVTGRGTGVDDKVFRNKIRVIEEVLLKYRPLLLTPLDWLWAVGGLEIAAMVGFIIGAAEKKTPVVLDGLITSSAALVACRLEKGLAANLLAGHQSQEPGHRHILDDIGLAPLLNLSLRLGEGTGGALAAQLVISAVRLYQEMATFESAHVPGPH